MSISKAIYKILSSETDLTNLVSTRIFPSVIPQNETYPSLMYEIKEIEPIEIKARRHPKSEARVVIGVHATSYADVQNIADIVTATLERYKDATDYSTVPSGISGTPPTGGCSIVEGYWIQEVFYDTSFDIFNDHLRVFEKYLEFDVRFMINPASMGAYGWYTAGIAGLLRTTGNAIPSADLDNIGTWYDGSGATSLNLTDEAATKPDYFTAGYLKLNQGTATPSHIGLSSQVEFTQGCTMFFILQENTVLSDWTFFALDNGESGANACILYFRASSGSYFANLSCNGSLITFYGGGSLPTLANKTYFAFSWGGSSDETGEWEIIDPNNATYYNKNEYNAISGGSGIGNVKFRNIGATSVTTDPDPNSAMNFFETVIFNKKLTFGGGQYNRIKDYLLNKHNLK